MIREFALSMEEPRDAAITVYAVAKRVYHDAPHCALFSFAGIYEKGVKRVFNHADDCSFYRAELESVYGEDLSVVALTINGGVEEISWPKNIHKLSSITTPGSGTW